MNDNLETMVTDEGNSNQEYLLHGKRIGYLATCLAYNRKELPLHYGRFLPKMRMSLTAMAGELLLLS
ncbi:hypothetical protein GL178_18315 [Vibrio toranzoniae]|uniref:hypothetical protein n=1 Tax=Vibrio toranzoniae TaxID=1194427 RepID=UPI0013766A31|nr:hypothetical protein [Vibrio toranzoniae]NAZ48125.1 hypothetical protein [Vibrio toranzoniae]